MEDFHVLSDFNMSLQIGLTQSCRSGQEFVKALEILKEKAHLPPGTMSIAYIQCLVDTYVIGGTLWPAGFLKVCDTFLSECWSRIQQSFGVIKRPQNISKSCKTNVQWNWIWFFMHFGSTLKDSTALRLEFGRFAGHRKDVQEMVSSKQVREEIRKTRPHLGQNSQQIMFPIVSSYIHLTCTHFIFAFEDCPPCTWRKAPVSGDRVQLFQALMTQTHQPLDATSVTSDWSIGKI